MIGYALFRKSLQVEGSIARLDLNSNALPSSSAVFRRLTQKKPHFLERLREGIFAGHGYLPRGVRFIQPLLACSRVFHRALAQTA